MASRNVKIQRDESTSSAGENRLGNKRNAEESPEKPGTKKRTAFCDLTNAAVQVIAGKKQIQAVKKPEKKGTRRLRSLQGSKSVVAPVDKEPCSNTLKSSQDVSTTDEDKTLSPEASLSQNSDVASSQESILSSQSSDAPKAESPADNRALPPGVDDFDKESLGDQYAEPRYAMDIFEYYKSRELKFQIDQYMSRQTELSKGMRAVLADWLVEVQESFELNHETLYLAVKFVDLYLMKKTLSKSSLQLLGATSIFIACKFDERCPPSLDDFLYICDDAYTRKQLLHMEVDIIKTLDFDLGIPLSYRFLRRYARSCKVSMEILTLARYILEYALMEYEFVVERDSMMAAAALHLALRMKGDAPEWTASMEYYSGYKEKDILDLERRLNHMIACPTYKNLSTVKTKYSHRVFHEVAKIPSLPVD